ncbi:serine/arginine-rich splicing factor 7-like [Myzus persicae]|uniref:serine/arginine-rich splicing factor 7-like n=1 Tax=Myzus persicae TaxID=13164 RepID=UPI000B92FE55|nr:serine/arginine-rich splicing factor 7-like [Myzus persicae]
MVSVERVKYFFLPSYFYVSLNHFFLYTIIIVFIYLLCMNFRTAQYVYNISGGCQLYFGDAARPRLCYNCGGAGHLARDCTRQRSREDNRGRRSGRGGAGRGGGRPGRGNRRGGRGARGRTNTDRERDRSLRRSGGSSNGGSRERSFSLPLSTLRIRSRSRSRLSRCSGTSDRTLTQDERAARELHSGPTPRSTATKASIFCIVKMALDNNII